MAFVGSRRSTKRCYVSGPRMAATEDVNTLSATHEFEAKRVAALFGLDPQSPSFVAAVTHPSFAHEERGAMDNQRLEFLGDAILDFVVSDRLYKLYPEWNEGKLTRTRAQLVSTGALARFARRHDVAPALRFGKGAGQASLDESDNVLADAVEALLAATYLDGGMDQVKRVSEMVIEFGLSGLAEAGARDAKSELQEKVQALGLKAPVYRVLGTHGPAHEVTFEVEVAVMGHALARGAGRSKRVAERNAADAALSEKRYEEVAAQKRTRSAE